MLLCIALLFVVFFMDTATTEIYTYCHPLALLDSLPICTAAILAELHASTKIAVAPPAEAANAAFAYDDFGTPGKIVSDERVEDLGIRRIRFANNVMLNIKTTDFQKDKVMLSLRVDGGNQIGRAHV